MKRVDLFTPVHDEIRALLFAAAVEAARVDLASDHAVDLLNDRIERLLAIIDRHEREEHAAVIPILQDVDRVLAATLLIAHDELEGAQNDVARVSRGLAMAAARARGVHGPKLVRAINRLTARYLAHADHEETVVNAVLWGAVGDTALATIRERMLVIASEAG